MQSLKGLSIVVFVAIVFSIGIIFTNEAKALDDFNLAKYGPDDTIEIKRTSFIVKLVLYDFPEKLNDAYAAVRGTALPESSGVRGFAVIHPDEDVCFVHIIPADIWDNREAMAIMGHEVYHCALADHKDIDNKDDDS